MGRAALRSGGSGEADCICVILSCNHSRMLLSRGRISVGIVLSIKHQNHSTVDIALPLPRKEAKIDPGAALVRPADPPKRHLQHPSLLNPNHNHRQQTNIHAYPHTLSFDPRGARTSSAHRTFSQLAVPQPRHPGHRTQHVICSQARTTHFPQSALPCLPFFPLPHILRPMAFRQKGWARCAGRCCCYSRL